MSNKDDFRVSQSKVKTFRKCHRSYHNRYVEKLRRKRVKRPLMFGRVVHEMLDAHANADDPFQVLDQINLRDQKMFAAERDEYGDLITDIRLIMTDYFNYWSDRDMTYIRKNKRSAEHEFEIEIFPNVIWNGKIDAMGKTPNKLKWLVENKTFTRMPGEDERWRNLQSATYLRAVDMLGWPSMDGTCWNYIRSKSPPRPGILQDGTISRKKLDTLPSAVLEVINENDLEEEYYREFIASLDSGLADWFTRIHTPVSRSVVDKVFADFEETIRQMIDNHGKVKSMCIDRHCGWCDYEPLCRAELQGSDVDFIREREYTVKAQEEKEHADDANSSE